MLETIGSKENVSKFLEEVQKDITTLLVFISSILGESPKEEVDGIRSSNLQEL